MYNIEELKNDVKDKSETLKKNLQGFSWRNLIVVVLIGTLFLMSWMTDRHIKSLRHDYESTAGVTENSNKIRIELLSETLSNVEREMKETRVRMDTIERYAKIAVEEGEIAFRWRLYEVEKPTSKNGEIRTLQTIATKENAISLLTVYDNGRIIVNEYLIDKMEFQNYDDHVVAWAEIPPYLGELGDK